MTKTPTRDATEREVSRTSDTKAQYRRKGAKLLKRARRKSGQPGLDLESCLEWYCDRHQRYYSAASLRFHRQAWLIMIDDALLAGEISQAEATRLRARLDERAPPPKGRYAVKRTSSLKVKDATLEEIGAVTRFLLAKPKTDSRDEAASYFLLVNSILGLRPVEWCDAVLYGDILHVRSAKMTNGRGLADVRPIRLVFWSEDARRRLEFLLDYLHEWAAESKAAFLAEMDRLRQRIAHACRKLGVRRLCLYGTRHSCIASLRRAGVAPAEIAAQVGHGTTRTHTRHYARARSGLWIRAVLTKPADREIVAKVRDHKAFSLDHVRPHRRDAFGLG